VKTIYIKAVVALLICTAFPPLHAVDSKTEQKRADIRQMTQTTLQMLYKDNPGSKEFIERAVGYAVFSNLGVKILVAGSGNGKGMVVNNASKHETFMKMLEIQAGLGMGVKKFRLVFVFNKQSAFDSFVNSGWQLGAQSTAAAKTTNAGGAMAGAASVSDGVWVYQLTDRGLALELTGKTTKYYKDSALN
jgi:lipid-binding SYLF domain-containing protein